MLNAKVVQVEECLVEESAVESQSGQHVLVERVHFRVEKVQEAVFDDTEEEFAPTFGLPEHHCTKEVGEDGNGGHMAHYDWL